MGVWNVNYGSDLLSSMTQSTFLTDTSAAANNSAASGAANFQSEYARILSEKISEIETQLQDAKENLKRQQENLSRDSLNKSVETVKRYRPDGSIMITTYEDGHITEQTKITPHLVPVPDYSAPPTPSGQTAMKLEPHFNLLDLLML